MRNRPNDWLAGLSIAAALLAGCRGAAPTVNPFPNTRVPPPGTGQAMPGNTAPPYYQNTPAPAPAPGTVPPGGWQPMSSVENGADASQLGYGQLPPTSFQANSTQGIRFPAETASSPSFRESAITIPTDSTALVPARTVATPVAAPAAPAMFAANSSPAATAPRQAFVQELEPRAVPQPQLQPAAQVPANPIRPVQFQQALAAPPATAAAAPQVQYATPVARTMTAQPCVPCTPRAVATRQAVIQCDPCNAAGTTRTFATFAPGTTPTLATGPTLAAGPTLAPVEITDLPPARATGSAATAAARTAPTSTGVAQATFVSEVESAANETAEPAVDPHAEHFGYHTKYQWISGRLEYSGTTRLWKLRYIPIDGDTDQYGGSVLIANPDAVADYKPGEYVRLQGGIVAPPDDGSSPSPAYQVADARAAAD